MENPDLKTDSEQKPEAPVFAIESPENIDPFVEELKKYLEKNDVDLHVKFRPKKARASNSKAQGQGLDNGEVNIPSHFTLQLKDNNGNDLTHGNEPVTVHITDPDGNEVPCSIVDNGDGTYGVDYTPTVAGPHKVDVKVNDEPIDGSPFTVKVDPAEAVADFCTAEGPGLIEAQHDVDAEFTIKSYNKINEPIPVGGLKFDIDIEGPSGKVEPKVTDNENGTYGVIYKPLEHGTHKIKVTYKDNNIKDSPFTVEVERNKEFPDPSQCVASGPGVEGGFDTADIAKFVVESRLADGSKLPKGGFPFKAEVKDAQDNAIECELVDNGDGTYSGEYKPTVPGEYTVEIRLHNKDIPANFDHIKDSPFHPKVEPGVDARYCILDTSDFAEADDCNPTKFKIIAKDCLDNEIKEGGHPFKVSCVGPDGEDVPVDIKDNGDGTYDCAFQAENPGKHRVKCSINDEDINGTPCDVDVAEGVSSQNSGIENFSFTIQARNKKGELITSGGAKFDVKIVGGEEKKEIEGIDIQDLGEGKYYIVYKVEEPGEYTINCLVNKRHIMASPWKQTV